MTSFWTQLMCLKMGLALPTITFHLRRSVRDKPTSRCKTTLWMLTILSYKPVIPGVAFIWQINKKVIKITFQSWILSQNHSVNDISLSFQAHITYSSFVHPWLSFLKKYNKVIAPIKQLWMRHRHITCCNINSQWIKTHPNLQVDIESVHWYLLESFKGSFCPIINYINVSSH